MKARKMKLCFRCGSQLKLEKDKELKKTYSPYFCPHCDENMWHFEIRKTVKKQRRNK